MDTFYARAYPEIDYSTRAFDVWALAAGNPTKANDDWSKMYADVLREVEAVTPIPHPVFAQSVITIDGLDFMVWRRDLSRGQQEIAGRITFQRLTA